MDVQIGTRIRISVGSHDRRGDLWEKRQREESNAQGQGHFGTMDQFTSREKIDASNVSFLAVRMLVTDDCERFVFIDFTPLGERVLLVHCLHRSRTSSSSLTVICTILFTTKCENNRLLMGTDIDRHSSTRNKYFIESYFRVSRQIIRDETMENE